MRILPITVLCIDDDDDDTEVFREAIGMIDSSCICITVSSATDGLRILETAVPDVIFLDINMPVIGGREALRRIRAIREMSEVPIYMLSTTMDEVELSGFRSIGATGCFTKPKSFQELYLMLAEVLMRF
jgi:CheY-like chemotaxis protein